MTALEPRPISDPIPNPESNSATTAALDSYIKTLTAAKITVEIPAVKATFESAIVILTLVRDEIMNDDALVKLAEYCARTCQLLNDATHGRDVDSSSGPSKKAIEDLARTMHNIGSMVNERRNCDRDLREHRSDSTEDCLITWKTELLETLRILDGDAVSDDAQVVSEIKQSARRSADAIIRGFDSPMATQFGEYNSAAPGLYLNEDPSLTGDVTPSPTPGPCPVLSSGKQALLQRLINRAVAEGGLVSVIEAIFSNEKVSDIVEWLRRDNVQTFVDVVDEALKKNPGIESRIRKKCLRSLYKTCAKYIILPKSLQIEPRYDPASDPHCGGGFADVWRGEYRGMEVAIKVLKVYATDDSKKVARRFCKEFITWKDLDHPNVLPLLGVKITGTRFAMVSEWMANGNLTRFVKAHQGANRFELLGDAARGLIYLHGQGVIHGDLKGINILIDKTGHACLADFGLAMVMSGTTASSSPFIRGGTSRWMSPELFSPEDFGLMDSRRTEHSDCYALGMVIYEVLSGRVPFSHCEGYTVISKVGKGERPLRPQGAEGRLFTDIIWTTLERCWMPKRDDRPSIEDVLQVLEEASRSWTPPLLPMVEDSPAVDFSTLSDSSAEENSESSPVFDYGRQALRYLTSGAVPEDQLISTIEVIFSSGKVSEIVQCVDGNGAQMFIDIMNKALDEPNLTSRIRKKCLRSLYKACAKHVLLPRSLQIEECCDPVGVAFYRGGFADVWKGEHRGLEVAVKVLRFYRETDFQMIARRFCKECVTWRALRHPNVLPLLGAKITGTQFTMVSEWMVNGRIDRFVKAHPDVNRFELLGDAARGLVYMHSQGMIHGDLKGANILVNQTGHACLTDFGLLRIVLDATKFKSSSSFTIGGTARWMGPELVNPNLFGSEDGHPTRYSDCYALGMVVYEVLSGKLPFFQFADLSVFVLVLRGEHPWRPRGPGGTLFTDDVWGVLERCWAQQPSERPSIVDLLQYFEEASRSWMPPPPQMEDDGWDSPDSTTTMGRVNSVEYLSLDIHISTEAFPAFLFFLM